MHLRWSTFHVRQGHQIGNTEIDGPEGGLLHLLDKICPCQTVISLNYCFFYPNCQMWWVRVHFHRKRRYQYKVCVVSGKRALRRRNMYIRQHWLCSCIELGRFRAYSASSNKVTYTNVCLEQGCCYFPSRKGWVTQTALCSSPCVSAEKFSTEAVSSAHVRNTCKPSQPHLCGFFSQKVPLWDLN